VRAARIEVMPLKAELLELCGEDAQGRDRVEAAKRVEELVATLAEQPVEADPEAAAELMAGRWRLLVTFTPGQAAADFFSLDSWKDYFFKNGPSPVQSAAFSNSAAQRVYQAIDLAASPGRWHNVIDAQPLGILCLQADVQLDAASAALDFRWTEGWALVRRLPWSEEELKPPLRLPYPVPFRLLGDKAKGTFETLYLDKDFRISKASKSGSIFVLIREDATLPMESEYYQG